MKRVKFTPVYIGVATAIATLASATVAQAQTTLPEVQVIEFRGEQVDSIKYSRDLQDTPRIITILTEDLLQEQNVTSLRDAMRNIPGISLQAGEGNPPGGDQLKIRGFNARDDINVNGVSDLGNYFRDPFYIEQLEVVKGPNSTFGGRGSAGGTINFVTKKPLPETATRSNDGARLELSLGTASLKRATLDLNKPIDLNSAVRINLMTHDSNIPGRDVVKESRHGLYAAYTWGFIGPTKFTVDYLHTRQNNTPDQGIPFDREGADGIVKTNRPGDGYYTGKLPPKLDFSNYYGHVDDYQKIDVDQFGLTVEHLFGNGLMVRNQTRYAVVKNDSITSSPRIKIPTASHLSGDWRAAEVQGDMKPRDQKDQSFNNQTDLLFSFMTASIAHDMVVGFEFGRNSYENKRRPDVSGPRTNLYNPAKRTRPAAPYDDTVHKFDTREVGAYLLDTMALTPQWDLNVGLRYDRVTARARDRGHAGAPVDLERTDNQWSHSLGLVYKPRTDLSLYAAMGTAYEISGTYDRNQVQLAGGANSRVADSDTFNVAPEKTRAYEIGAKWEVLHGLDLNAAVFRTDKTNARTPGIGAGDPSVLDGKQRVEGFELLAAGRVTPEWRLYGGYTYLQSKVLSSPNKHLVGQGLGGTPKHAFNLFSTYDITPKFSLGGGLQYVASQSSSTETNPPGNNLRRRSVTIPSYTVVDAYATYRFTRDTSLRVNVFNVFDKKYISQMAEGGAQGIPGAGRQLVMTLRHDF